MRRLLALVLTATVAAGCGGSSGGSSATTSSRGPAARPEAAAVLPLGKEDLALEAKLYRSPEGFVPTLTVDVPAGWRSIHRYADAFDITQPDPGRDAPLVAVLWMTPPEPTAAEALATLKSSAGAAARPVTGRIGTTAVTGIDLAGGSGTIVRSAQNISIDFATEERTRVLATDIEGKPLLVVITVPVAANWDRLAPKAQQLIDSTRTA